jgi:nicotinamide mononucleotide transporter
MSVLEIIGVIVSALAIWLTARRKMLCWPVGLISVALYGWIFFDAKLYSDMLLQAAFAILQVYGWWVWLAQKRRNTQTVDSGEVRVQAVTLKALVTGLLLAVVGSVVLGSLMARLTDAALPYVDASLTAFSLVAQYWTARRYIASWWLWIVVDVVYVGMFLFKGLYATSGLYALFVALAVIGLRDWSRAATLKPAKTPRAA